MLHFLGLLFFIVIIVLLIGFSIIGAIVRRLFNIGQRQSMTPDNEKIHYEKVSYPNKKKKVFTKDDGEYIDFEEVKD